MAISGSAADPLPESAVKRRAVRRLNLSEHVIVPWLFVASVVLVLVVDLRVRRSGYYHELLRGAWKNTTAAAAAAAGRGEECDWFEGQWVRDETYPLYESAACPFLDPGFRCAENRRPDRSYTQWRWQPARCNLPRSINSSLFLLFLAIKDLFFLLFLFFFYV